VASYADEVAALRGTRSATLKDLVTHPAFSRLAAAMGVSSLGDWVGFVAVTSLVARLAGTQAAALGSVAAVMIARMAPAILFGPFAGAIVDRVDRKRVMIAADVGRGAMYASMPFVASAGQVWAIYVLSFLIEGLSLLWTPARDAALPNLVPRRQLNNANAVGLLTTYGTLPLGGAVAAVLAGISKWLGADVPYFADNPDALALWLDAGTFAFSAFMISRIPMRTAAAGRSMDGTLEMQRVIRDIVDGVRFLRGTPLVGTMTTGIVVAFCAVGAVLSLGPVFAVQTLHAGTAGWPILVTCFGIGMACGMGAVNMLARSFEREVLFAGSMIAASGTLFVLAAMPNISLAAVVTIVLGVFCGTMWVTGYTLLQENVEDEFRGRTFGSLTVVARLALFLSLTLFPLFAALVGENVARIGAQELDLSGPRAALWLAGIGALLAGAFTGNRLRRLRLRRPQPLSIVPKLKRPPGTGVFIAFEGIEGAGKGTQIEMTRAYLESEGHDVLVTREPGGTELGERLRELVLDPRGGRIEPRAEALLFAASRTQHVASVIRPALAEGKCVVCDRYIDSSVAYQGVARGLGEQDILSLNVWGTQGLFPDLVVLLHVEPELGLERLGGVPDRIEAEGAAFLDVVSDAYLRIAEEHPERFVVIDASGPPDRVFEGVRAAIARVLRDRDVDRGERGG
jgi:dTMP kinase